MQVAHPTVIELARAEAAEGGTNHQFREIVQRARRMHDRLVTVLVVCDPGVAALYRERTDATSRGSQRIARRYRRRLIAG